MPAHGPKQPDNPAEDAQAARRDSGKVGYHHGDLRQALLAAGDAVLQEKGFRDFTLRECARRAGVSHAAPKHHFGDVRGFLTEIASAGFERLTAALQTELARASSLHEEFAATTRAYLGFAERYPEHFRLMFRCDLLQMESASLWHAAADTFTELTNVIRRQRGEPPVSAADLRDDKPPAEIVEDIVIGWCHIHGFAHLVLEQQLMMVGDGERDRVIDNVSRRLSDLIQAGDVPRP